MTTKRMFRLLSALLVAIIASLGFTATANAASPHYVRYPTATVGDNSLTVSFKAAGLGNAEPTADFILSGDVTVESQCYTKSGNPVNGVPKYEIVDVFQTETFPIRHGQVTGSITIAPLSTLECTGKQVVRILSVDYDLDLYNYYLGTVPVA